MKFLFLFVVLTVIGARANYTYDIISHRTSQTVAPGKPIVNMYYEISPSQSITYFVKINDENPFLIEYYIFNDEPGSSYSGNQLNGCDVPADGSLDYLVVKTIQMNLMPDGKCPIEPGNYTVEAKVDPITVTLPEKLRCGNFVLTANLHRAEIWGLQVGYTFSIEEDGNCAL